MKIATGWASRRSLKGMFRKAAIRRFDKTLHEVTGGDFTLEEIGAYRERVMQQSSPESVEAFRTAVFDRKDQLLYLTEDQERTLRDLAALFADDPLGRRVQDAFQRACETGMVRRRN